MKKQYDVCLMNPPYGKNANLAIEVLNKSKDLADTFLSLPNDRILVETDSPYLSPEPLRGKPNEPSHIIHTVNYLASLKDIDPKGFAKLTSSNFFDLFGKLDWKINLQF